MANVFRRRGKDLEASPPVEGRTLVVAANAGPGELFFERAKLLGLHIGPKQPKFRFKAGGLAAVLWPVVKLAVDYYDHVIYAYGQKSKDGKAVSRKPIYQNGVRIDPVALD